MPEDYELDDIDEEPEAPPKMARIPTTKIRQWEQMEKDYTELSAKVSSMERLEAFRSVGIDPTDPRVKYFVKGYDGDLTPDAIREEAVASGLMNAPAPSPDLTAHQQMSAMANAAESPTSDAAYLAELHAAGDDNEKIAAISQAYYRKMGWDTG